MLQCDIDSLSMKASPNVTDEDLRLKQFMKMTQDEDDFLTVLPNDSKENCPFALKLIACQLLHEIATFLRETHQYLPKKSSRRNSVVSKEQTTHIEPPPTRPPNTNRRWSMALSK